jgi:membrane protease YdiL (CAAX protease family)
MEDVKDMQGAAAPTPDPGGARRVPWTVADVIKALVVPAIFFGLNVLAGALVDEDNQRLSEGELISTFAISMGFQLFLLGLVWAFTVRRYRASWADLGLRKPARGGWFFPLALVMAAFFIVYAWIGVLDALGVEGNSDVPDGTFDYTSSIILLAALSMGSAPIVEELFFRGFVFAGFRKKFGLPLALLIGGSIFGLAHAGTPDSFIVIPAIAAVGALFAWGYVYSGSLLGSIVAHLIFNWAAFAGGVAQEGNDFGIGLALTVGVALYLAFMIATVGLARDMAIERRRNHRLWIALSILFGFWAVLLLWVLGPNRRSSASMA